MGTAVMIFTPFRKYFTRRGIFLRKSVDLCRTKVYYTYVERK